MARFRFSWAVMAGAVVGGAVPVGCSTKLPPCQALVTPEHPEYALVEYRYASETGFGPGIEIRETPAYVADRGNFKTAAIRLPTSCLNEGATGVTGAGNAKEVILQTQCGPWLGEIEKALSQVGFRVMSWDAVWQLEKQKGLSTYNAAKDLGADIVFVFNSLEPADIKAGAALKASYRYFTTTDRGQRGNPLPLDDQTRAGFQGFIQKATTSKQRPDQVIALSAVLDATAVPTKTGESIWFYRRTLVLPTESVRGMRFLFGRMPGSKWEPAIPNRDTAPDLVASPVNMATEDQQSSSVGAGVDPYAALRLRLIREIAEHFSTAFRNGTPEGGAQ